MRGLACCSRDREISVDFDEQERIVTYVGLGSCIDKSYDDEKVVSTRDGYLSDSMDDDKSSCSSSKEVNGSYFSHWSGMERDEDGTDGWEATELSQKIFQKAERNVITDIADFEAMKEKYSKLLLGDDTSGGSKGVASALALSKSITRLAASVFGELWKLEPLTEEKKTRWHKEMDWLLTPTNYMVELVPTKQNGDNGCTLEIMTPKARADIHMNLPALQKLDSMLIGILDSMVNTEFWYMEDGTKADERVMAIKGKRWWLPLPRVPKIGLSDSERKKLLFKKKIVYQVFKASKAINDSVLLDMPVPAIVRDSIPKSGRVNLGEDLFKVLSSTSCGASDMASSLPLHSENSALEVVNKLESAIFAWKEKAIHLGSKSPSRVSWSFMKDPISEHDKVESFLIRAETLLLQLKSRYPNLPHTFLDASKIQYGRDVGHSILEAYSRVLGNLALRILARIGDVLQEDALCSSPQTPVAMLNGVKQLESPCYSHESTLPLISQTIKDSDSVSTCASSDADYFSSECISSSATSSTPSRSRVWYTAVGVSP